MGDRSVLRPAIGVLVVLTLAPAPALAGAANGPIGHGSAPVGIRSSAQIRIRPTSGPAGTSVEVRGRGFLLGTCTSVDIDFIDGTLAKTFIGHTTRDGAGRIRTTVQIPITAPTGEGKVVAIPFTILGGVCRENPFGTIGTPFTVTG